ncbi:MAG: hypothetical protein ACRCUT_09235, partial [Spirochaetota bacterium]
MMEDMYATMTRINQIRERFNMNGSAKTEAQTAAKPEAESFTSLVDAASVNNVPQTQGESRVRGAVTVDAINALAEREA